MMTFLYAMLCFMILIYIALVVWFVDETQKSNAEYQKAMDEIYGGKR